MAWLNVLSTVKLCCSWGAKVKKGVYSTYDAFTAKGAFELIQNLFKMINGVLP